MAGHIGKKRVARLKDEHIPSWLRHQLYDAARRANGTSYALVGWHLANYHPDDFALEEHGLRDLDYDDVQARPTTTLRALFRTEEHPHAEFVDLIPLKQRRELLRGLLQGITGDPLPEFDELDG